MAMNKKEAHCGFCGKRVRAPDLDGVRARYVAHLRNCPQRGAARAALAISPGLAPAKDSP